MEPELGLAAWLALASLDAKARERCVDGLETLATRMEARANPLAIDFGEGPLETALQRELGWFLPIWTAARWTARRRFVAGDRSLAVSVLDDAANADTRFEVNDRRNDPELRLARLLAWPICAGHRLCHTRAGLEVWDGIRKRALEPKSHIALVIDSASQRAKPDVTFEPDLAQRTNVLRQQCTRLAQALSADRGPPQLLLAMGARVPSAPALSWLSLNETEAWVVPKLSSAAKPEQFRAELEGFHAVRVCSA